MERDRVWRGERWRSERGEGQEAPGRRTNTDRMKPAAQGTGANGLYANASALAAHATSSEREAEPGDQTFAIGKNAAASATPAKPRQPKADQPKGVEKAARPGGPKAPGANDKDGDAPADAHAKEAAGPASASATAPAKDGGHGESTEGGRGGRSGGTGSRGARGAAAAVVSHEVAHHAPDDASPTRTTVGVGEQVTFRATESGNWRASASTNTASGTGTEFVWRAQDTAGTATITYERTGHPAETVTMTVVAPTSITFRKSHDLPQEPAGAGMRTNLSFGPFNVSFAGAEWLETPGEASGVTGYFDMYRRMTGHNLFHNPAPEWISMEGERNNGVDDLAYTADKPKLLDPTNVFAGAQWFEGGYHWVIPNKYRVAAAGGDGHAITNVTQSFSMANGGAVTVTKSDQSVTQSPAGVIEGNGTEGIERLATVEAATQMLNNSGDSPYARLCAGLQRLATFRVRDPESYRNLLAAIRAMSPAPRLYVAVRCTNTYSVFSTDSFSFQVNGGGAAHTETFEINTDQVKPFRFAMIPLFNLDSFDSLGTLTYNMTAVSLTTTNTFTVRMPFPFNTMGRPTDIPGSDGRYRLTSFVAPD